MIHQNNGVAVSNEIVHHSGKSHDVGRMQTDGRFVKNIQDARRPVADSTGQLHPLTFSRG